MVSSRLVVGSWLAVAAGCSAPVPEAAAPVTNQGEVTLSTCRIAPAVDVRCTCGRSSGSTVTSRADFPSQTRSAFPAPRLRALVSAFPDMPGQTEMSICEADWILAAACVPGPFGTDNRGIAPKEQCFTEVALDVDLDTPGLQPSCVLERRDLLDDGTTLQSTVPSCDDAGDSEVCWWPEAEDMTEYCRSRGGAFDMQISGLRPAARGTCLTLTCAVSDQPPSSDR